jgi:hypothetical protein
MENSICRFQIDTCTGHSQVNKQAKELLLGKIPTKVQLVLTTMQGATFIVIFCWQIYTNIVLLFGRQSLRHFIIINNNNNKAFVLRG